MKYCVIGKHLPHTLSPIIHNKYFVHYGLNHSYSVVEIAPQNLSNVREILADIGGANVTIPYKEQIIPYLDEIIGDAKELGAVNVINCLDGKWTGYNTDTYGFGALLDVNNIDPKGKVCVVLGSGGASKSVEYVLKKKQAKQVYVVSRTPNQEQIDYKMLQGLQGYLIVNTTPVGMSPNIDESPVNSEVLSHWQVAVDIVYNPTMTKFLELASSLGMYVANGLYMLVAQAVKAQEYWQNIKTSKRVIDKIYRQLKLEFDQKSNNNIYLIGMMGCGKSTIAKELATKLGYDFIDTDQYIVDKYNMTIPKMFEIGEDYFRKAETSALSDIVNNRKCVVATGGGIIKNPANVAMMKASGQIVWLDRKISLIEQDCDTTTRPLLQGKSRNISTIFQQRKGIYSSSCDMRITNNGTLKECLTKLKKRVGE